MNVLDIVAEFSTVSKNGNEPAVRSVNTNAMAEEILSLRIKLMEASLELNELRGRVKS